MTKWPALLALISRLHGDLGHDYFVEVPDWDADLTAIGLGRPDDPSFLVYLSVWPDGGEVYVECEAPALDDPLGYDAVYSARNAGYEQILGIVRSHLAR